MVIVGFREEAFTTKDTKSTKETTNLTQKKARF